MRPIIRNTLFFIGWLLSPLTFWNDAFVNIPLAYLLANILIRLIHADFFLLVLVSYWVTNGVGLYMMYAIGRNMLNSSRPGLVKEVFKLIVTTVFYSLIIVILGRMGILKAI